MHLGMALARLLKLVPEAESISLSSSSPRSAARVWAQTKSLGVLLHLDSDVQVPDGSVRVQELLSLGKIRAADDVRFGAHGGYGYTPLHVGPISGSVVLAPAQVFPDIGLAPGAGKAKSSRDWSVLPVLLGFAGDRYQGLSCVVISEGKAEATDRVAFARARVNLGVLGKVPVGALRELPAGVVSAWQTPGRVWVAAPEEVRWTTLYHAEYPDTSQIPERHPWQQSVVPVAPLLDAVGRVEGAKAQRVRLEVGEGVRLSFESSSTVVHVQGSRCPPAGGWFSAPRLGKILRKLTTPAVAVGLGPAGVPLRLDSGVLSVCLWPLTGQ